MFTVLWLVFASAWILGGFRLFLYAVAIAQGQTVIMPYGPAPFAPMLGAAITNWAIGSIIVWYGIRRERRKRAQEKRHS